MSANDVQSAELKRIVQDVLGANASKMLLGRMYALLEEEHKDPISLKQACGKIEQMTSLFHGPDKAKLLGQRFKESLSKTGFQKL